MHPTIVLMNTRTISTMPEPKQFIRSLIATTAQLAVAVESSARASLAIHTKVLKKPLDPLVWNRVYYLLDIGRC
jgi:hypothetical protein